MKGRITIAGAVAQKAGSAGHTWQFLQYLLGFKRLGYEVLLVDRFDGASADASRAIGYVRAVMAEHGLEDCWSVDLGEGLHAGLSRDQVLAHLRSSELLLNVMGFATDEELLGAAPHRVFLDTDPGFAQMWHELGWADLLSTSDTHVTIGERIGADDCSIPTCGLEWVTTCQPVVLEHWRWQLAPPRRPFTSVATWRGAYDAIELQGTRYGLRAHEFRRLAELPRRVCSGFELALSIDPADASDVAMLENTGWELIAPSTVAHTSAAYRRFVMESTAEFMVAKGIYVKTRGGWFSERSACYLACGRPVLAQDTGLADLYPLGEGLIAFSTLDEAVAGVQEIAADYSRHSRAAHDLAEARFDSDKVLGRLLEVV
ncbi:MAG TPA: glycosyltransferase [Baekduia sp.]|nr:glycosyltransferase [Baekduia sp.]